MSTITVILSPLLANRHNFKNKIVVVVDILRATTTMVTAFEFGVKSILPVDSVEQCLDFQKMGYIGAAERGGKIVEGFKLGNSPFDYLNPCFAGKKIVLTTTNGTKTIYSIKDADRIVFGAFVNLGAMAGFLNDQKKDFIIICAGWEGEVNLEDTLFAGALIDKLIPSFTTEGDPAMLAHKLFIQSSGNLSEFLEGSSHFRRLQKLDLQKDIDFCLTIDKYETVPELIHGEIIPCTNV
jgi:2-phosphosulfolactate phosphatase